MDHHRRPHQRARQPENGSSSRHDPAWTRLLCGSAPRGKFITVGEIAVYSNELPCEFQLLDDDDNLYFVGRCSDLSQQDANSAFEPLDRLGAAYGCTTMMYRTAGNPLAAWEQL